jgi:competence protein ComEA
MIKQATVFFIVIAAALCSVSFAAEGTDKGAVNINTADVEELQLLPRVGPALAQRIVEFRTANGDFKSIDELVAVRGIGEKSLESLKPYVRTDGATTLTEKVRLPRSTARSAAAS